MDDRKKGYIGDGVYAAYDGYSLILTAEDGIRATDTIYLEPDVWASLISYVERLKESQAETSQK